MESSVPWPRVRTKQCLHHVKTYIFASKIDDGTDTCLLGKQSNEGEPQASLLQDFLSLKLPWHQN